MKNCSILTGSKCCSSQKTKDGTISFWGEDSLPVITPLQQLSNLPTWSTEETIFSGAFAAFHLMFS